MLIIEVVCGDESKIHQLMIPMSEIDNNYVSD